MIGIPVICREREDKVCSFWDWDIGYQGPGLGLDGFVEWHNVLLPRPAHDVIYRGVETEEFLGGEGSVSWWVNRWFSRTLITAWRYGMLSRSCAVNGLPLLAALADLISRRRRACTSWCFASSHSIKLMAFDVVSWPARRRVLRTK